MSRWERELGAAELEQKRLRAAQLKAEGNSLYKEGRIKDVRQLYTHGLRTCSSSQDRAVLYANCPKMKKVFGLVDHAVKNCSKAIKLGPDYVKVIHQRAELYHVSAHLDQAQRGLQPGTGA